MGSREKPDLSTVGKRLKAARTRVGINGAELGTKCGLGTGYVSMVESFDDDGQFRAGRIGNPKINTLEKLAGVLGVRVEWLAFGSGKMMEDDPDTTEPAA